MSWPKSTDVDSPSPNWNLPGPAGVAGDLRQTWRDVVTAYSTRAVREPPALLAACPPCQGLSSANGNRGREEDPDTGSRDARNLLVVPIAAVATALAPRVIVVENVRAFLTRKVRHPRTREAVSAAVLLISLLKERYVAFPFLSNLADYGVPQTRVRSFITFVRRGEACLQLLRECDAVPIRYRLMRRTTGESPFRCVTRWSRSRSQRLTQPQSPPRAPI